jgi:hypothetical protein
MRAEQNQIPGLKRFNRTAHKSAASSGPDEREFSLRVKMPWGIKCRQSKVQDLKGAGMSELDFFELGLHCALVFRKRRKTSTAGK